MALVAHVEQVVRGYEQRKQRSALGVGHVAAQPGVHQRVARRARLGVEGRKNPVLGKGVLHLHAGVRVGQALAGAAEVGPQLRLQPVGRDKGQVFLVVGRRTGLLGAHH